MSKSYRLSSLNFAKRISTAALIALPAAAIAGPADSAWIPMFNKADTSLATNWDIKIRYSALNVDTRNTFRRVIVGSDTMLEVNYSGYTTFNNPSETHGNIGYKIRPFNYYVVRVEHQFFGSQPSNSPTWALQNNGIMHHSQSVASFGLNQDFPISLEAQLLGPSNTAADNNSSMNLCTPGTAFYTTLTGGSVNTNHCVSATTKNRDAALAPNWAWARVEAYSDSIIKYYFKDSLVYTFYRPVQYSGSVSGNTETIVNNTPIKGGYIILQGESAPTRFRRVEVLNLEGCMTTTDANYKSYLIKHDSTACAGSTGLRGVSAQDARYAAPLTMVGNAIKVGGTERVSLEVFDMSGTRIGTHAAQAPFQWSPAVKTTGVHVIRAITPKGTYTEKATLF
jgi:hypothetical protein